MRKILIATHGKMASGIKSTINILTGMDKTIDIIDAYLPGDNSDYTPKIKEFVTKISSGDEGVIFTDMMGGSVNQKVVETVKKHNTNVFVITSVNLPIVLSIILEGRKLSRDVILEVINQCHVELVEIKGEQNLESLSDEDNFF